jgi:hypothetical protein
VASFFPGSFINIKTMKKQIYAAVITLLISDFSFSQPAFNWARGFGSANNDYNEWIATDAQGNSYVTGSFEALMDADPGPGTATLAPLGSTDVFVSKFDAAGNFVWTRQIAGTSTESVYAISVDLSGHLYLSGSFSGSTDFDPGAGSFIMASAGGSNAFICKLDTAGNLQWAKQFAGSGDESANDVATDSVGNVYITGQFMNTTDFDPGPGVFNLSSNGNFDIFVCKLNASGNFIWARSMGQSGIDGGLSIASGNAAVYVAGRFTNTIDIDPGPGSYTLGAKGNYDVFFTKLDSAGIFLWAGGVGGSLYEECKDMVLDSVGNIYATGWFEGTADFDPNAGLYNLISQGSEDVFVIKMNGSGSLLWARSVGGPSQDNGRAVATMGGNVYVTGMFDQSVDFDPGDYTYVLTTAGNVDMFIVQLNAFGNFICAGRIGGVGAEVGQGISVSAEGNIFTSGVFSGYTASPADFDPSAGTYTLTSTNNTYDFFLARYKSCSSVVGIAEVESSRQARLFPNPVNGDLNIILPAPEGKINVYNSLGTLLLTEEIEHHQMRIDLSSQANGIYFIEISTGSFTERKKIVKQ